MITFDKVVYYVSCSSAIKLCILQMCFIYMKMDDLYRSVGRYIKCAF